MDVSSLFLKLQFILKMKEHPMNKIFKIVWNHATQTFIVVSELAKSHTKVKSQSNQSREIVTTFNHKYRFAMVSTLVGLMLSVASSNINAAVRIAHGQTNSSKVELTDVDAVLADFGNPDNSSYENSLNKRADNRYHEPNKKFPDPKNSRKNISEEVKAETIGIGARSYARGAGIAIGGYARAGKKAEDGGNVAVAIGAFAQAESIGSIALGVASRASKQNSFAAMRQASATGDFAIALGTVSRGHGNQSIALGASAFAEGNNSIAIGSSMTSQTTYDKDNNTHAKAQNSVALGYNAKATLDNSLALGSYSTTTAGVAATDQTISGHTYTFSGQPLTDANHVFSVGSAQYLRQIQNVASGRVISGSTDAINGGQLFSALTTVGNVLNTKADKATKYTFKVGSTEAKSWTLGSGNDITFTSGNNNIVASVHNGGIQ